MRIDLQELAETAPELTPLATTAGVCLAAADLADHQARVALCLDISGSMYGTYTTGAVQALAERILALGLHFDDNQAIDVWLFNTSAHPQGAMGIANFRAFIGTSAARVGGGTCYAPAMRAVRAHYFGGGGPLDRPAPQQPVYCMFVTDGAPFDLTETEQQLQQSSHEGLFWQFMALGARDSEEFAFLRALDDVPGRALENTGFFAVEDPHAIDDERLYSEMMRAYPSWVAQARATDLID